MPTSKEEDILEKQRRLARMMRPKSAASVKPASIDSSSNTSKAPNPQTPATKAKISGLTKTLTSGMAPTAANSSSSTAKTAKPVKSSTIRPTLKRPRQAILQAKAIDASSTSSANASTSSVSSSEPLVKRPIRPSFKRPARTTKSSSVAGILAEARAKATGHPDDTDNNETGSNTTGSASAGDDTKLQRKPSAKTKASAVKGKANRLASLVQNIGNSPRLAPGEDGSVSSAAFATNISPDDFWKNMREWDFVVDLAEQQREQNKAGGKSSKDSTNNNSGNGNKDDKGSQQNVLKTKPLPNTFVNHRHYIAAWAPLCMAEARAQLLSDFLTDMQQFGWKRNGRSPLVLVNVETTWKSGNNRKDRTLNVHDDLLVSNDSCNIQLALKKGAEGGKSQIFANDVCCLVPTMYKDIVEKLLRGGTVRDMSNDPDDDGKFSFRRMAMIGHTEVTRRDLNGLILKVSKRRWAQIGEAEMYVVKLGGNITSLREFTALCNIERLPLVKYLLGQHLRNRKKKSHAIEGYDDPFDIPLSSQLAKGDKASLLKKMGGVQALGKGFTSYAKKKFNPSQLTAISASAQGYGDGGFTLIKGPPGTGKTTTLVAILNSLHIRQYNKYYDEVRRIVAMQTGNRQAALDAARKAKPRLLVCAPSNAAVDNIILKIMEDGFVDGSGQRYNPSMIRVGIGQSSAVKDVALENKVDAILSEHTDIGQMDKTIAGLRMELQRISGDIAKLRRRVHAIYNASPWPLAKDWEIRVDEATFDNTGRVYFVNHKEQTTTYECPPPPEPGETQFPPRAMPEYKSYTARIVKLVENYFSIKSNLERTTIIKGNLDSGANRFAVRQSLENHVLNSVHMVMTTLGTAGNRILEGVDKFEVVVVDEAAQSVEPATLSALQLGSRHAVLVGDPQQLPATIFNVSGRGSKFDRSLFQRMEEAGQDVFMLNEQYRMHPKISHFPRHIFYGGNLKDGPNVTEKTYGNPLVETICSRVSTFHPFTVLDLDSREERGGTSLANSSEAHLAVHLYASLREITGGLSAKSKVAVITPYSQQAGMLRRFFTNFLGNEYERYVEVNTVDAFQGREANIVIFSAVRAAGSHGIGFLSDVRRMNVALTRAKFFLFVIARCKSIVVNPYWRDLVEHARETHAVVRVPLAIRPGQKVPDFGNVLQWDAEIPPAMPRAVDPRKRKGTGSTAPSIPQHGSQAVVQQHPSMTVSIAQQHSPHLQPMQQQQQQPVPLQLPLQAGQHQSPGTPTMQQMSQPVHIPQQAQQTQFQPQPQQELRQQSQHHLMSVQMQPQQQQQPQEQPMQASVPPPPPPPPTQQQQQMQPVLQVQQSQQEIMTQMQQPFQQQLQHLQQPMPQIQQQHQQQPPPPPPPPPLSQMMMPSMQQAQQQFQTQQPMQPQFQQDAMSQQGINGGCVQMPPQQPQHQQEQQLQQSLMQQASPPPPPPPPHSIPPSQTQEHHRQQQHSQSYQQQAPTMQPQFQQQSQPQFPEGGPPPPPPPPPPSRHRPPPPPSSRSRGPPPPPPRRPRYRGPGPFG